MARNLLFFICILGTLESTYLNGMESPEDTESIYSKWILLLEDEDYQTDTILPLTTVEKQIRNTLEWTIKKGGPPKIIKKLAPPELHPKLLRKARSNFIQINGKKFALETAILQNNLNFIKALLSQTDDNSFKAMAFSFALLHGKRKTVQFLAHTTPELINQSTMSIVYDLISKTVQEESIRPLKLLFKDITIFDPFQRERIIIYGLQESEKSNFTRGTLFFKKQQQIAEKTQGIFMRNTL